MESPRVRTRTLIRTGAALVFFCVAAIPVVALANGVPMPVDPGEFYVEASLGYGQMSSDSSSLLRTYVNDEAATGGTVTLVDSQGFLASFDTNDSGWQLIPGITLGFATKEPWFDGALGRVTRFEVSADYYKREASHSIATIAIPQTGYTIDVGGVATDTGLVVHLGPIDGTVFDGSGNAMSGAVYGHPNFASVGIDPLGASVPTDAVTLQMEEATGNGQMMVFFDEPKGSWVFTRGAGVNIGHTKASYDYAVPFRELSNFASTWDDLVTGVARHDYDFDLNSTYIGVNAAFSIGYRPIKYFTLFWNGSFSPGIGITHLQGRQWGFCLVDNDCSTADYATIELDVRDLNFAYDARSAAGVSLLFYRFVRVTAQAGAFASNSSPQPYEKADGGRFEAKLASMWGYYGRASVMLSF